MSQRWHLNTDLTVHVNGKVLATDVWGIPLGILSDCVVVQLNLKKMKGSWTQERLNLFCLFLNVSLIHSS